MKKGIILIVGMTLFASADFMDSVADMVKSTLSDEESVSPLKSVTTLFTGKDTVKKDDSLLGNMVDSVNSDDSLLTSLVDTVEETIGIKKDKKDKGSMLDDTITAMKEVTGLEKVKADNSFFDGGIMGEMADIIEFEKGDILGLPSVFGINKKKQKKVFGSTVLADTILGDAKDTGTGFYKGFKNTGESAEFMSGMMYNSSKVYNEMFHVFDDSVFNIFEDDEDEKSIFDVFEHGNEVLDIFD